jgi:hypothetical protein
MPGYEVWVHHSEDVTDEDRMDEMLNVICPEFELDFEDTPTP